MYMKHAPMDAAHLRRLLVAAVLVALASSLGGAKLNAVSSSPSQNAICKCAHCLGGPMCCCQDPTCTPH
jgi:hypothetical protein